jgi:TRAP-type C4-dicarboxylate transport system permease small subunit
MSQHDCPTGLAAVRVQGTGGFRNVRLLFKPVDLLTDLGAVVATALLGILVCSLWYEVVARYFFHAPTEWAQSVALYCALTSVMLMIPYLSREGHHVGMSLLFEILPKGAVRWFSSVMSFLSSAICALAAYICWVETARQFRENVLTTDNLFMPLWILTAFMVYGFVMAALQFARHAVTGFVPKGMEG